MSNDFLIKRHLAKTMTWRIVGSIDTMLIGWLVSGNPLIGLSIGGTEVITKMIFYFVHERLWLKIDNRNHDIVYKYRHDAHHVRTQAHTDEAMFRLDEVRRISSI